MATFISGSWRWLPGKIDADGHRTWQVKIQTQGDPYLDGPVSHQLTAGLPLNGSTYAAGNDLDLWAWCHGERGIDPMPEKQDGGVSHFWHTFTFSTRPANRDSNQKDDRGSRKKCADQSIQDPLMEPASISRNSLREQREEAFDKDGKLLTYTSFEQIRGPQATFDRIRDQVTIEQNLLSPNDTVVLQCLNKVNDDVLWDLPNRCWKLCDRRWQRKLYGTCSFYYVRTLVFESNVEQVDPTSSLGLALASHLVSNASNFYLSWWDHHVLDESSKFINGHWNAITGVFTPDNINGAAPNPNNPQHYVNAFDRAYQPIRAVLSNDPTKKGQPAADPTGVITMTADANYLNLKRYQTANMLLLGIPTTLGT